MIEAAKINGRMPRYHAIKASVTGTGPAVVVEAVALLDPECGEYSDRGSGQSLGNRRDRDQPPLPPQIACRCGDRGSLFPLV